MVSSQTRGKGRGGVIMNMRRFRRKSKEVLWFVIKLFGIDNKLLSILQTYICVKHCLIVSIITIKNYVNFFLLGERGKCMNRMLKNTQHCPSLLSPHEIVEGKMCWGLVGEMTGALWLSGENHNCIYSKLCGHLKGFPS